MSLDYTVGWQEVENTVNDRILDDSLLHTLCPDKKIKKETKILNQKLKKNRTTLRSYKQFLKLKRQARKACQDGDETDDEPGLSHDAYKKIHSERPKTQLQTFLRFCTLKKKRQYPKKTKGKSPTLESEKLNESATFKRPICKTTSKANILKHGVKSTGKTSITNSNNVRSKLSETKPQSSQIKLLNTRRVIHSLHEDNHNQSDLQKDDNTDEKNTIENIVQDLLSSNVEIQSLHESSESDSKKLESAAIKDNMIVENLPEEITASEPQYNVTDRSSTCLELDNDSVVSNDQEQENFGVIAHVTDHLNASNSASSCRESSNKDNLLSQEDIFMTNGGTLNLEENLGNENDNKKCIDHLNHDPGNENLFDADISMAEYEKSSDDEATACGHYDERLVTEHCLGMNDVNEEGSIAPDDIVELEKNVIEINNAMSTVILNNGMVERVKLSDRNSDIEGSKEIISIEQTCDLQLEAEFSNKSTANDRRSKLKIRTIEHCDEGYKIFSKRSLRKEKKLETVNDFDNKSMENESISKDEQSLRCRKSSENYNPSQSDSQHFNGLRDHEDSIETRSVDDKLPSENEQSMRLRTTSENCNLSQNESQHLNGLIDHEDSSPLFRSNPENCNNSMNTELLPESGEEQAEGNKSSTEYNTTETPSFHLNETLNSSFSSFSARSCVEDLMNIVKTELLSEIEQRLRDSPSSKKKKSWRTRSRILNGSFHDETENSLLLCNSNEQYIGDKLIANQSLIEYDAQPLEDNGFTKKSNSPKFQQHSLNRSSDIEDSFLSPKSSTPTKRRNSSKGTDYCLLENTPRLSKLPRLHEESTHKELELIPCERKKNRSSRTLTQILNGSLHNKTENSLSVSNSNEEDPEDKLINNQSLIEDDAQSVEENGSTKKSNSGKYQQQSSNRSSDNEDSFLSPESSTPTKRRNSSKGTDYCLLESTPRSSKLLQLHKKNTNRQLELIPWERKSQEALSNELQQTKNRDDSQDHNKQELNTSKNIDRTPKKRTPRPRNLEDLVVTERLTQDSTKPHFRLKDIGDDDEIWIMNVPKTINPEDLEDQVISLGGKTELKFGDEYYKVSSKPAKTTCNVFCIFATSRKKKQYKIANIESKGNIKFRQQYSAIPKTKLLPSKVAAVPFPKNLRIRHPLLGTSYKDKI